MKIYTAEHIKIQGNQTNTCVGIVMENSPTNLLKLLGADKLKYYKGLMLVSLVFFAGY